MLSSRLFTILIGISRFFLEICTLFSLQRWQLNTVTAAKQSCNSIFVNSRERRKNWLILKKMNKMIIDYVSRIRIRILNSVSRIRAIGQKMSIKCALSVFWKKKMKTRRMAIANGTCVSFCNQPKTHYLATSRESRGYVVAGADIWLRQESLRHIFSSAG